MRTINLYPAPGIIETNNFHDDFPPVFEPVNEYQIPNALINSYGYIFKNFKVVEEAVSYRHRGSVGMNIILKNYFFKKKIEINRPAISMLNGWLDSFYHFTLESLVKLYVLREHLDKATVVFHQNANFKPFHKEWIEIIGLKDVAFLRDDEILKTPLAISSTFTSRDLNHHNIIIPEFRNWVLDKIENAELRHLKIFIGRKNARFRNIINLEEVRRFLSDRGFAYVEMENYDLKQQINLFRNAEQIISLHGAALTNMTFASPQTRVMDLIHEDFNQLCFYKLAKILEVRYEFLRCEGSNAPGQSPGHQDIKVELNQLEVAIEGWQ